MDTLERHHGWINDINETQQCNVDFPIISDDDRNVSTLYDFIHPNASATATVRSLVVIGPDKAVKLIITYPASTGRNFTKFYGWWIHCNLRLTTVWLHRLTGNRVKT